MPIQGTDERRPNESSQRRFLTVMFCDVVGSTHLSRERDVEAYFSILRAYYDACTPVVERHGVASFEVITKFKLRGGVERLKEVHA